MLVNFLEMIKNTLIINTSHATTSTIIITRIVLEKALWVNQEESQNITNKFTFLC